MRMLTIKFNLRHIIILISYSLITITSFSQSVLANNEKSAKKPQKQKIVFNWPTPPPVEIPKGRPRGGGSRGPCQDYHNLTALVPVNNEINKIVWGKTIAHHPEFLFYLPQGSSLEFVLQDEADNYVYRTSRQISPDNQGIVSISIPHTVQSLEPNQIYKWTLSLACENDSYGAFVYVKGSIEKVALEPNLQTQLKTVDKIEKAVIYAREGIWYDAIALLAQLRSENPNDEQIDSMWSELLEQVNLTEIASQPVLN